MHVTHLILPRTRLRRISRFSEVVVQGFFGHGAVGREMYRYGSQDFAGRSISMCTKADVRLGEVQDGARHFKDIEKCLVRRWRD